MRLTGAAPDENPQRPDRGLRPVLTGLCVTEIVSWGVLYYAFPVLAPTMRVQAGWSTTQTAAAFSAALVVAAVVGVPVGRVLDRRGPRVVMTSGSVLATVAVGIIAWSPNLPIFAGGWLLAGIAMAGVLYQPAFAAITGWYQAGRLRALTTVTLIAGLASTVFAPLTDALSRALSWRQVYLVLGLGLASTIPLHAVLLRRPWPYKARPIRVRNPSPAIGAQRHRAPGPIGQIAYSRPFVLLVAGMALGALAMYAALINLVPLMTSRGLPSTTAAWLLGLGGVGQVAGRVLYTPALSRVTLRLRTVIIYALISVTIAVVAMIEGPLILLIVAVVLAGVGRGIATLLQATAVPDRWHTHSYGRLSALLAAPITAAGAIAPWLGASLAATVGGYTAMFVILAVIAALATVLLTASVPPPVAATGT